MSAPKITGFVPPKSVTDFSPKAYRGDSPPRRDVIEGRLPRGKVILLAGEGDIGKSWLLLETFCAINDGASDFALGGRIVHKNQPCIFLSGEDDRVTIDLRLKTIRQGAGGSEHGLLIPVPDLGSMPLAVRDAMGDVVHTDVYKWLDRQINNQKCFGELGLLVVDTYSTFFHLEGNSNGESHTAISLMTALAAKHDICIVVTHHVNKHAEPGTRASIRGATSLVDACRGAYAFYKVPEKDAKFIHARLPEGMFAGDVVRLQLVKNNLGLRRDPITYIRQQDGRLLDVSELTRDGGGDPASDLIDIIAAANAAGVRITKTGPSGMYASRAPDWSPELFRKSKHDLESLVTKLIEEGRLISDRKRGLIA